MDPYMSEIRLFPLGFVPRGWATCAGQLLPINQNQALFALLGTTYGGDGRVNFALPDLRGRAIMHAGSGHTLGERGGQETVTLNIQQLPQHTHGIVGGTLGTPTTTPTNGRPATAPDAYAPASAGNLAVLAPQSVRGVGGSQAHENRQPYLTLVYCIALQGVFPSPS